MVPPKRQMRLKINVKSTKFDPSMSSTDRPGLPCIEEKMATVSSGTDVEIERRTNPIAKVDSPKTLESAMVYLMTQPLLLIDEDNKRQ